MSNIFPPPLKKKDDSISPLKFESDTEIVPRNMQTKKLSNIKFVECYLTEKAG